MFIVSRGMFLGVSGLLLLLLLLLAEAAFQSEWPFSIIISIETIKNITRLQHRPSRAATPYAATAKAATP